jgi:RNA polymerase sigma factor (sigma-70 family)
MVRLFEAMNRLGNGKNGAEAGRTDAELVHAARRGDKRAFVEIVARHQAMVCGIALGILGDFAASEDAGQEAFLTAWRKIHELRDPQRLRFWLGQIARNAALGHLRRKRGDVALEDADIVADESPAPDEVTANEEEAELVRASLSKLPETYRLPLILFYREGQSVRAVADSLGISEDAVKQRLARGREMLRDRMSGLIETVLTRSGPTAVFTMGIAVTIGALAAPAAVAGAAFAASTSASTPLLTAMSTSKTMLATAAAVAVVCIPLSYYISNEPNSSSSASIVLESATNRAHRAAPNFENSALFREWQELHDKYGRTAEAMPVLYKVIGDMKDTVRRRAFRAALIAEWVQLDARGGFAFLLTRSSDNDQRRQFLEEWLVRDPKGAVDALLASGPGWESMARDCLNEIARRVPSRLADVVSRLPKAESFWDTEVRDAFAVLADCGLASARSAAQAVVGPNREQALCGLAQVWAKADLNGTLEWAKSLPDGTDRDEVIRLALMGRAAVDPVGALELIGLVPPGGRYAHFATSTGARVLNEAAKADFDTTVAWIAANPGRLRHDDMMGMAEAVTDRLNADPAGFLTTQAENGSLEGLLPAIDSALMNRAGGQKAAVWEWLQMQPESHIIRELKKEVLTTAAWHDPKLALALVDDVPHTLEGDAQLKDMGRNLFNGGNRLHRFEQLLEQAPERLRVPMIEGAFFECLGPDDMDDPQKWIARLSLLPDASRAKGVESIARAWAGQALDEAVEWVGSLPAGDARNGALAQITTTFAKKDLNGAAEWVAAMDPGLERDHSAAALVPAIAQRHPQEAWEWLLSIEDPNERNRAATDGIKKIAARDPATARQWIESGLFAADTKAELEAAIAKARAGHFDE